MMIGMNRLRPRAAAWGIAGLIGLASLTSTATAGSGLRGSKNKARENDPTNLSPKQTADVQYAMGRSFESSGDVAGAMAAYHAALKGDPKRADACRRLAILNDSQGKFRESAALYAQCLQLKPGDPDTYCDMGYSFYLQRRWADAEMNFKQAIVLKPDHARAHTNLGLLLARTERLEPALAEFRKAGASEADARVNLAFALTMEHRWPEAREHYQRALQADPSCVPARDGLRELDGLVAKAGAPRTNDARVQSAQYTKPPTPVPARSTAGPSAPAPAQPSRRLPSGRMIGADGLPATR